MPTAKKTCRFCDKELPWGRSKWCSNECGDLAFLKRYPRRSGSVLRMILRQKDRGVCNSCGLDCGALEKRLEGLKRYTEAWKAAVSYVNSQGFDYGPGRRATLWDADHVVALDEGGSWHPDNAQTLCQPCHKAKTKTHAARKATRKRMLGWKHRRMELGRMEAEAKA